MKRWFFFLLFVSFSLSLYAKATVCLNMIVKNESQFIEECLSSIKPFIDYWVIVDTGSTDGTQKIINEYMKDIPGELHEREWKNYAHNRNEALELAKGKTDYFFWIDGDDWIEYEKNFQLPELTADAYIMKVSYNDFSYSRHHILKNDLPWRWEGVVHEYLFCNSSFSEAKLDGIKYCFTRSGARACSAEKYTKHAEILEDALKEEPNNTRYAFYLAQSYRDSNNPEKALECYKKRVEMGGWEEEVYWSLLQIALLQKTLNLNVETIIESFNRAHRYRPHRLEPIYYLAEIYNQHQQYALAYECIKGTMFRHLPTTQDILFCEQWIEEWGLVFQLSICSYYLEHYHESLSACDNLLKTKKLPENFRQQTILNRTFPLEKIKGQIPKPDSLESQLASPEFQKRLSEQLAEAIKEEMKQRYSRTPDAA